MGIGALAGSFLKNDLLPVSFLRAALLHGWDMVLSEFSLPNGHVLDALQVFSEFVYIGTQSEMGSKHEFMCS